jgi:hypothetical protein
MSKHLGACCAALVLALCARLSHTWAPGPGATMPFGQASGPCELAALGGNEGFVAVGNANYVAGAAIGNGIGNAVRQNRIYNACMEALGFVAVDQPGATPSAAAPFAPTPAVPNDISTMCGGRPASAGGGPGRAPSVTCN